MAEVTVLCCDVCDKPGAVRHEVATDDDQWVIDLCSRCSEKLRGKRTKPTTRRFKITQLPPQNPPSGA